MKIDVLFVRQVRPKSFFLHRPIHRTHIGRPWATNREAASSGVIHALCRKTAKWLMPIETSYDQNVYATKADD